MRTIRHFLTFYCVFFFAFAVAQNTHPVKFQTPEVSAFNRLVETPVSLSTGIPDIKIPIHNIRIRDVEVPISLTYSAGGVKVEEEATWVGLSWNLNFGGQISRKQRGVKDEKFFMRTADPSFSDYSVAHYLNLPNFSADPYLTAKSEKVKYAKNGLGDYMPDEFYYSALGYSGRMMFNQGQGKFVLFPKEDINPSYTMSNLNYSGFPSENRLDAWNLKLPNGTSIDYGTNSASSDATLPEFVRNAWNIKTITNKFGDQISFNYEPITYTSYSLASETYNVFSKEPSSYISSTTFRTSNLTSIIFPGGKIEFTSITRQDMPTKCLSVINVYDHDNVLVKKVEFIYGYFVGDYGGIPQMAFVSNDYRTKRLRLDRIKISGPNVPLMEYKFDYHNSSQYSPSKHSYAQDFWGFFNSRSNSTLIPKTYSAFGANRLPSPIENQVFSLKTIYYPEGGRTEFDYECNTAHGAANMPLWFFTPDGNHESFYVGGLRIKSIKNYDNNGKLSTHKSYGYVNEYSGKTSGWLLSLPSYVENTRKTIPKDSGGFETKYDIRLYATSRNPLQTTSSSFVGYETVTEEQVSIGGNLKSVYSYSFHDSYYDADSKRTESEIIDANEWLRGKLDSVKYLKDGIPIKREKYEYYTISPHNINSNQEDYVDEINTDFISWQSLPNTSDIEDFYDGLVEFNTSFFKYYVDAFPGVFGNPAVMPYFKRYTGFDKLKKKKTISYDGNTAVEQEESYYYDSTPNHHQISRTESIGSKGNVLKTMTKYPKDMVGVPYSNMAQNNLMDLPIEQITFNNGTQVKKNITNYLSWLYPDNEQEQIGSGQLETKLTYKYNAKYNLQELLKDGGVKQSYIWDGVSFQYPTAEILNAAFTDVGYTSFEIPNLISNGDGGWSFVGYADTTQSNIPVGKRCYPTTVGTTFTKNNLNPIRTYDVTYWSKTGAYTLTGNQPSVQLKSLNGWVQYMHQVSGVSTVSVSGRAGYIDELSIWPSESIASTYAYKPLGLLVYTSKPNKDAIYYEYDAIGRLKNIKDQNKNLVKDVSINFKGIGPTIYKNTQITKYFIKTNCAAGTLTDSIPFTVYENSFSSLTSQLDADQQARSYLNSAGQANANAVGVCKFYSVEKNGAFAKNDCGSGKSGSSILYVVPARTYTSSLSQADADAKAEADVNANGQLYANSNGQCVVYAATISVSYNNQTSSYWSLKVTNVATSTQYTSSMGASYSGNAFASLPTGVYNMEITPLGPAPSNPTSFIVNGIMNKIVPSSYSGILSFNNVAINSASSNPLVTVQAGFIPVSCTFTGSSSWQIETFNISNTTGTQTSLSLIASVSNTSISWSSASNLGYIVGVCSPSVQKTFNCTENGRTWEMVIYPTGQLTTRLVSGTAPTIGTQIIFSGNFNL